MDIMAVVFIPSITVCRASRKKGELTDLVAAGIVISFFPPEASTSSRRIGSPA